MLRCLDVMSLTQAQVGGCCCQDDLLCRGGADWKADDRLPTQERSRNRSNMDEVIIIDELRLMGGGTRSVASSSAEQKNIICRLGGRAKTGNREQRKKILTDPQISTS